MSDAGVQGEERVLLLIQKLHEPHGRVAAPPQLAHDFEFPAIASRDPLAQRERDIAEIAISETYRLLVPHENRAGIQFCLPLSREHASFDWIVRGAHTSRTREHHVRLNHDMQPVPLHKACFALGLTGLIGGPRAKALKLHLTAETVVGQY